MARGFLSGVVWGAVVSVVGLGTTSVLTDPPDQPAPEAGTVEVPVGSAFNTSRDDTEAVLPEVGAQPEAPDALQVVPPAPDDLASLTADVTQPAAQPETGAAEGALDAPADGAEAGGVQVDVESPVLPSPQAVAPEAPESEAALSISTDPAQPQAPEVMEEAAFPEEEVAAIAGTAPETGADEPPAAVTLPDEVPTDEPAEAVTLPSDVPEDETAGAPAEAVTLPATVPEDDPLAAVTLLPDDEPAPEQELSPEEKPAPEEQARVREPEAEDATTGTIGDLAPDVETNRLPSVDIPVEAEDPAQAASAAERQSAAGEGASDLPPLERYAAAFDNPQGKPLMSIILIDDGSTSMGLQTLENFPYPLSFAVDASWDGAEDAMEIYRAAGFEVLAMVNLPDGAGAQDAEVAMQTIFEIVPEAVAVIEGTGTGLQSSRAAAEQLGPILMESGHGAVFFPKGLNTAQQLLAREGVPSVSVFRDFDAKGQDATVIRRFLDQAAFKAGQEDAGVVMVGRMRPDTVSALLLWGLQDRASRVALAPISVMLRSE